MDTYPNFGEARPNAGNFVGVVLKSPIRHGVITGVTRHNEKTARPAGNGLVGNIHDGKTYGFRILIAMAAQQALFIQAAHPVTVPLASQIARAEIRERVVKREELLRPPGVHPVTAWTRRRIAKTTVLGCYRARAIEVAVVGARPHQLDFR